MIFGCNSAPASDSSPVHLGCPTKVFEDGINLMHLNYLLAFDGVIASRGGIPLIDRASNYRWQLVVLEERIPRTKSSARQGRQ